MSIYTRARPTVSAANTDTNEDPEISNSGPRRVTQRKTGSLASLGFEGLGYEMEASLYVRQLATRIAK